MAKTKTTTIKEQLPDDSLSGIDPNLFPLMDDELLTKIKAEYPTSLVKVKAYKIVTGKSQGVFCFESEDKIEESQLQEWGGGRYALRFYADGLLKHTVYFEVADKPQKPGTNTAPDEVRLLREQIAWNQQMILAFLGRNTPVTPPTPMQDIVAAWSLLNQNKPANGFDTMSTLFVKGLELGMDHNGGGDWKGELIRTVKDIAPAIINAATPAKNGDSMPQIAINPDLLIKQGLDFMKTKVVSGLPVGLALDWIVANSNDPQYQQFMKLALGKSWEDLCKIDPELNNEPFKTWFTQ